MSRKNHDFGSLVCIYSQLLPRIRARGKRLGYAIAVHGTMQRDFDLLAAPWTEKAAKPELLVRSVANMVGGYVIGEHNDHGVLCERPQRKPHGRLSWNICWGGRAFIDLSVMPLKAQKGDGEKGGAK